MQEFFISKKVPQQRAGYSSSKIEMYPENRGVEKQRKLHKLVFWVEEPRAQEIDFMWDLIGGGKTHIAKQVKTCALQVSICDI